MTALLLAALATTLVLVVGGAGPPRRPPSDGPVPRSATVRRRVAEAADRRWPSRRARRRDALLPDALDRLATGLRSGQSIGPALGELAPRVDEPLRADLGLVATALERGAPVATALQRWAGARGAGPDVHLVVAALSLGAGAGGEVARAVDRIAGTLRERHELQAEVRALATQARTSAAVLGVAPLTFAALVATIEPRAATFLVTSPIGVLCLVGGLALEGAGAVWMGRITRSVT